MEKDAEKSVKLAGGLDHTATWIKISGEGDLIVEWYDYSEEAHRFFGNDVAYLLTVQSTEKGKILRLLTDGKGADLSELSEDDALLKLMQEKFPGYFEVKQWLEANFIAYEKTFDSWA